LGNNFRKQLGESLWEGGAACGSTFARQLQTEILKNRNFAAFGNNFTEQLSGAALENSFGLWGTACGIGLMYSSFGATALWRCFGEQFWEAGAAFRSSFAWQL